MAKKKRKENSNNKTRICLLGLSMHFKGQKGSMKRKARAGAGGGSYDVINSIRPL
uniref:GekBS054 n=1 Tax=Gekko japonicus TaxID=146911 RepID=Q64FT3_GEKJA|nr:GekBS054 [Gekko japonicus]